MASILPTEERDRLVSEIDTATELVIFSVAASPHDDGKGLNIRVGCATQASIHTILEAIKEFPKLLDSLKNEIASGVAAKMIDTLGDKSPESMRELIANLVARSQEPTEGASE